MYFAVGGFFKEFCRFSPPSVESAPSLLWQIHLAKEGGDILTFLTGQEGIESRERLLAEKTACHLAPPPWSASPSTLPCRATCTSKCYSRRQKVPGRWEMGVPHVLVLLDFGLFGAGGWVGGEDGSWSWTALWVTGFENIWCGMSGLRFEVKD